jgi:hypothetical protein
VLSELNKNLPSDGAAESKDEELLELVEIRFRGAEFVASRRGAIGAESAAEDC